MLNTVEKLTHALSKLAPMAIPCVSTKVGGRYHLKKPVLVNGEVVIECVRTYFESNCTEVQDVCQALSEFEAGANVKVQMPWNDLAKLKHVKRESGSAIFMVA